jgi:nitric oxide synthase oxygenase domain/subunit
VQYACYEVDGKLIGDRANKEYTDQCINLGWMPPEPKTQFDVRGPSPHFVIFSPLHFNTQIAKMPRTAVPNVDCFFISARKQNL